MTEKQNYDKFEHNSLFKLFSHDEFATALANMLEKRDVGILNIKAHRYCIELSNSKICIAIIIFAGFELHDYNVLKYHSNLKLVSFCNVLPEMLEFKNMKVTFIDRTELLFNIINISDDFYAKALNTLITIKI